MHVMADRDRVAPVSRRVSLLTANVRVSQPADSYAIACARMFDVSRNIVLTRMNSRRRTV